MSARPRTIMIVNPNTTMSMTDTVVTGARRAAAASTRLVASTASRGVASVESNTDEVWGALAVAEQVRAAEAGGAGGWPVDGYVVACFGDTGVDAAREIARGPVLGMTEAALVTAAMLASRFTIVTLPPRTREQSHRALRRTGLAHRASVWAIDEPVASVHDGSRHLLDAVRAQARAAIDGEGAEALVLGCAGLADLVGPLAASLDVPVVDGVAAAVTMVEGLLAQGLSTSRAGTYRAPEQPWPVSA
ncbi:allantoin racemase [Frankia sp. AiPs1]|uniref:aspartate/glutamate racemase family protein n=1 Tax=Frankia sp. AiPa1 TaxID=573492 RepID=UPI00202B2943|nr:aspartate/glutamate racemase family protein [Frankia sp. AiPa1]MCL9761407.1 aspartate/glutamate racemase family protein [Frankia sp. AiPa1]